MAGSHTLAVDGLVVSIQTTIMLQINSDFNQADCTPFRHRFRDVDMHRVLLLKWQLYIFYLLNLQGLRQSSAVFNQSTDLRPFPLCWPWVGRVSVLQTMHHQRTLEIIEKGSKVKCEYDVNPCKVM